MAFRCAALAFLCIALCGSAGALQARSRDSLLMGSRSSKSLPTKAVPKVMVDPIAEVIPDEAKWMVMQAKQKFSVVSKLLQDGKSLWEEADAFLATGKVYAVMSVMTGGMQIGCKIAAGILSGGIAGPICGVLGSAFGAVAELFRDTRHSDLAEIKKDIQQITQSMSKVAGRVSSYQSVVGALVDNEGVGALQAGTRGALDELIMAVLDGRAAAMQFGSLNKTMEAGAVRQAKEELSQLVASISSRIEHWDEKVFFHVFNVEATHLSIRTNGIVAGIREKVDELSEQHQYTAHQLDSIIDSLERQDKVMDAIRTQTEVMNGKLDEIKDLVLLSQIECKKMMVDTFAKESHMIAASFKRSYCSMACKQSLQRVTFSGGQNILHMMLLFQKELDLIEGGFDTNGIEVPPDVCDVPAKDRVDLPGGVFFLHAVNTFPSLYNGLDLKRDIPLNIALELPQKLPSEFMTALTPLVTLDGLQQPNVDWDTSLHIAIMSEDTSRVALVLERLRRNNQRARKLNRSDTVLESVLSKHNRLNQSPITLAASVGGDIERSLQQLLAEYPSKYEELKNAPTPAELPNVLVKSISEGFHVGVSIDETKLHQPDYRGFQLTVQVVDSRLEMDSDDKPSIKKANGPKAQTTVVVPLDSAGYGEHKVMVAMESESQRQARARDGDASTDGGGAGAMSNNHVYDFTITLCRSADCTDENADEIKASVTDMCHESLEDLAATPHKAVGRALESDMDASQKAKWLAFAARSLEQECEKGSTECLNTGRSFASSLSAVLTQLEEDANAQREVDDTIALPLVKFFAWMHVAHLRNVRNYVQELPCSGSHLCTGLLLTYTESVANSVSGTIHMNQEVRQRFQEAGVASPEEVCAAIVFSAGLYFADSDFVSTSEHSKRLADQLMQLIASNACYKSKQNQMGYEMRQRRFLVKNGHSSSEIAKHDETLLGGNFALIVQKLLDYLRPVTCHVYGEVYSIGGYQANDALGHVFDPLEYKLSSNTKVSWKVDGTPVATNTGDGVEEATIRFPCLVLRQSDFTWSVHASRSGWFEPWIRPDDERHHCVTVLDLDEKIHTPSRYQRDFRSWGFIQKAKYTKRYVTQRPLEVDHHAWWTTSTSAWKVVVPLGRVFPGAEVRVRFNEETGKNYGNHWVIGRLYLYAADKISISRTYQEPITWTIAKSMYVQDEEYAPSLKIYEVLPRAAANKYVKWTGISVGLDDIDFQHFLDQRVEGLLVIGDQNSMSENQALKDDRFDVEVHYPPDLCRKWEVVA